ncbi:MAG: MFS transporter [Oscillospiraceae bacterium]|jgi:MFS family permease|nr:MFS transporter [Oscillospiraceae bacterium]
MTLKEKRDRHPLLDTLLTVKGNPRIALYTEPLWIVPFNLFIPFVSVYMAALLLTDKQIGLVASIFMFTRAVTAIFSGAVTDKLGRKLTTFIFDMLSWTIPCLLWAFSQNFWWFVVAAAFNGLMQIPHTSWTCLLVEDAEKESLVKIFSLLHMIAQLAVIFAPLAAILVNQLSVVPALRILYFFSFVSMTIKFFILYKYGDETEVGKTRLRETKDMSVWKIMSGYGEIYKKIFASHNMVLALTITTIFSITSMIFSNFFGLYVTGTLLIPEHYLAYFPIIRSVVIAAFLYLLQPKLDRFGFCNPMLIGIFIFIASKVLLILTPESSLSVLIIYLLSDAVAFSFVVPRSDSLTQILIEPSERARISGLMFVVVLGVSIPFGYIAGWLSDMDRRYPFALIIVFAVLVFVVIAANRKRLNTVKQIISQE